MSKAQKGVAFGSTLTKQQSYGTPFANAGHIPQVTGHAHATTKELRPPVDLML